MCVNIILGASGGIGRALVKRSIEQNNDTLAAARDIEKVRRCLVNYPDVQTVQADAADRGKLDKILKGCKVLFYCVNIPYQHWYTQARELLSTSIDACAANDVRLVFPGNVYVYGRAQENPVKENHPWKAHTRKGHIRIDMENMLKQASKEKGLKYTVIRMPDFYGPCVINTFSETFYKNALTGSPLQWYGNLDVPAELIFIEDAAEAMLKASQTSASMNEEYNVPGFSATTARNYLKEIAKQGGKGSAIKTIDKEWMVGLAGLFNPTAREFKEMMYLKKEKLLLDGTKYKNAFGSVPSTPYEEGIARTFEWARKYFNLN